MALLFNRAWMTTATAGTGTITLGSAVTGYATFAEAGVANTNVVPYTILDGNDFEIGIGTYTAAGTTLSRDTVTMSKIAGVAGTTKLTLSGTATVFITARREDLLVAPASSADNAAVRFDGTTGLAAQNSALLIADTTGALSRSGDGGIAVQGTNTNDAAAAGYAGEYLSASAALQAISLVTNTAKNITSLSITAGDWDVSGDIYFSPAATTTVTDLQASISPTTDTIDNSLGFFQGISYPAGSDHSNQVYMGLHVGPIRLSLASTTTYYLVAHALFGTSTCTAGGIIRARRVR